MNSTSIRRGIVPGGRPRPRPGRLWRAGPSASGDAGGVSGAVAVDGSSTVYPLSNAAAELLNEENPDIKVTVGEAGTGGGFEVFCAGQTDISDASRPIEDDEVADARTAAWSTPSCKWRPTLSPSWSTRTSPSTA